MNFDFFRNSGFGSIIDQLLPRPPWRIPFVIALGAFVGLGAFTFVISNAVSYTSDDPKACVNCHNMTAHYSTWMHSSHRERAVCNDCHVPHNNVVREWFFHAMDGMRHSTMFTLRLEPQVYMLGEPAKTVVQENCIRCHERALSSVTAIEVTGSNYKHGAGRLCWECHRETPHGRVSSQASAPYSRVPDTKSSFKEFLNNVKTENKSTK